MRVSTNRCRARKICMFQKDGSWASQITCAAWCGAWGTPKTHWFAMVPWATTAPVLVRRLGNPQGPPAVIGPSRVGWVSSLKHHPRDPVVPARVPDLYPPLHTHLGTDREFREALGPRSPASAGPQGPQGIRALDWGPGRPGRPGAPGGASRGLFNSRF